MSSGSLRILVVHNRYRSAQPSGEDRVVDQETKLLADSGHEIDTFERGSDDIATMPLASKVAVPVRVPWNAAVRTELAWRLRAQRPDIVHIHNTFPLISPSVVAACSDAAVPTVATLHNYSMICPPGKLYRDGRVCTDCVGASPLPAVVHGCYRESALATVPLAVSTVNRRRWLSGVSRFFCISNAQRMMLVQGGISAQRLAVKYNFVPDLGIRREGQGQHLLFLGRMTEEKGVRLLMAAWDLIADCGGAGVPLVLAGAGPLEDEVARWAHGRDDVRYLGLRSRPDCTELISRSVAVVAPSTWLEAFGLVAVEAMASGVPTIAAAHGSFIELIDDGHTGLLHRPSDMDSLARCLRRVANPRLNTALGKAARRRYEEDFTPSTGLRHLVAGYEAAIAGAGSCERV